MSRKLSLLIALLWSVMLFGQRPEILNSDIHTLQVERNGHWNSLPCIELGTRDRLHISFDVMGHEYRRLRYRVEPMTWDWKLNERLLTSEFLKRGIGDDPIEDFEESINTTVLYTNYRFHFPNQQTAIELSGNYRLVIYDDDEGEDMLVIPFYVLEDGSRISAQITTDTEIDFNAHHQQLSYTVQPLPSLNIHYPESEVHTVAMQNKRQSSAVFDPKPDYITPSGLQWEHCRDLIFPAGNEYHKFEMTTLKHGGIGMDNLRWFDPYYHATLFSDKVGRNYIYDEEKNGSFYINDIEHSEPAIEADYVFVHFELEAPADLNGEIYLNGEFTYDCFTPEYKMVYNTDSGLYENTQLLKMGYYNYQYLYLPTGSRTPSTAEIQGDFFQTENRYTILVYYSQRGSRYDRLIGLSDFQFSRTK
ncbi:MAG: DUF5103 domain-containing protein [Bacteroidaceae bacterium]|nr:DUF5103 domain-containing protein [Bacteroidaceae bacterium]